MRAPAVCLRFAVLGSGIARTILLGRLSQPTGVLGADRLRWVSGPFMDSFRLADDSPRIHESLRVWMNVLFRKGVYYTSFSLPRIKRSLTLRVCSIRPCASSLADAAF